MPSLSTRRRRFAGLAAAVTAACVCQTAAAQILEPGGWDLNFSLVTLHFHPSEDHEPVLSLGLMRGLQDRWLVGGTVFTNSFGQPSAYAYAGQRYVEPFGWNRWYLQWTAGVLYGYVDEFKDKVPFNYKGFSPGFVPSLGYKFNDGFYGQIDLLGTSAVMFSVVVPLSDTWFSGR